MTRTTKQTRFKSANPTVIEFDRLRQSLGYTTFKSALLEAMRLFIMKYPPALTIIKSGDKSSDIPRNLRYRPNNIVHLSSGKVKKEVNDSSN